MIESPEKADRREKEKARNPHDSWLFCERTTKKIFLPSWWVYLNPRKNNYSHLINISILQFRRVPDFL